ncbi:MAG: MFS transporter, partial [Pseudomonadota bacterium]
WPAKRGPRHSRKYMGLHRGGTAGWRRAPYICFGAFLQYGGLAFMPFSLIILSGEAGPDAVWIGQATAAISFLMVGAGLHTAQTAGLALATDIAPEDARPRVVALLYVMLLVGMAVSAAVFGFLLTDFTPKKLIQVIQGAAVVTIVLNVIALWKQEAPDFEATAEDAQHPSFREVWRDFAGAPYARRLLVAVGLGAAGFTMQDVLLEPYGGEVLLLSVSETTFLTAIFAIGTIIGFAVAARRLTRHADPHRLAGWGALVGVFAFSAVIFADPLGSPLLFRIGVAFIGFGGGLFSVCTLTAAMALAKDGRSGVAVGAWGAVQATCAGVAIALGGAMRDGVSALAEAGALGPGLASASAGYAAVYHLEIFLLFCALVAIGPLARHANRPSDQQSDKFGLAAFPG